MERDEILRKAREDYPIGTVFKCATHSGGSYTVEEELEWNTSNYNGITHQGIMYVYYKGVWGKIVSKHEPINEVINNYPLY